VKRAAWREEMAGVRAEDLVFADEFGADIRLTRAYARAPRGERAVGEVPRNHGKRTSVLAALGPGGLCAARRRLGAFNGEAVAEWARDVLCPLLRPGQVVVMDNASIHKGAAVREAVEAAGCRLVFLPAYSPDFSPIEPAISKLKAALRRIGARAQDALEAAIDEVVATVNAEDARGFFKHCGYSLAQ
jgi:transposase